MEHYDGPVFLRRQQHKPVAKPTPARRQVVPEAPAPVPTATATPKRRPQQPVAAKRPSVNSTHRFTPKYIPQSQQHQQHSDEQVRLARYVQALNKTNDSVLLFSTAADEPAAAFEEAPTFLPDNAATASTSTVVGAESVADSTAAAVATAVEPTASVAAQVSGSIEAATATSTTATADRSGEQPAVVVSAQSDNESSATTVTTTAATSAVEPTSTAAATDENGSSDSVADVVEETSTAPTSVAPESAADVADSNTAVTSVVENEEVVSAADEQMQQSDAQALSNEDAVSAATAVTVQVEAAESAAVVAEETPSADDSTATTEQPTWRKVVAAVAAHTPSAVPVTVESAAPISATPVSESASQRPPSMHQAVNTVGDSHDAKPQLTIKTQAPLDDQHYQLPPFSLLPEPIKDNSSEMKAWVEQQRVVLNETLKAFNVQATVSRWSIGPAVTQFEVSLARGVKVSKITNLSDDLKLALAAKDIRIEAPIPGKSTVGIEIPNLKSRPVMLSEVVESAKFQESKSPLTVALGVDLFGQPMITNVAKMPHGLIAGATGSGKSVFINSLLLSILFKAKPSEVKLLLIDPKAVELAPYNGLPHLLSPVISDPKAAAAALKWAVDEMENRYHKLAAAGVRNLEQFNAKATAHKDFGLKMPYIVIIIDELADLMMIASSEVQDYIVRITQKARAAGIHLLVATQRPSVDVITGTIKNNIPTRIAFMVSSQIDSRTIIDQSGAERLLGRGDMLYLGNGQSQPIRIQGTYAESEIDPIVDFVKQQLPPHYLFEPEGLLEKVEATENQDELFPEVLAYIADEAQVSTSKLQRVFSIGYNRAANLIDTLEQRKLISPASGSKPRDVYFTPEDLAQYQESKHMN